MLCWSGESVEDGVTRLMTKLFANYGNFRKLQGKVITIIINITGKALQGTRKDTKVEELVKKCFLLIKSPGFK